MDRDKHPPSGQKSLKKPPPFLRNNDARYIKKKLGDRSIVLVGLMGAGKSTVGKRLATTLRTPFLDADHEIEAAAGMTIPDIFTSHGEEAFRDGERKVISRLLQRHRIVLATGGGAFMDAETRQNITRRSISIWLKADLDILMQRVRRRSNRPLLQTENPEAVMRDLMTARYPVYEQADITVLSHDVPHDQVVKDIMAALKHFLSAEKRNNPNVK